jgi:hypothetical protein
VDHRPLARVVEERVDRAAGAGQADLEAHAGGDDAALAQAVGLQRETRVAEVVEAQIGDTGLHAEGPELVVVGRWARVVGVVVLGLLQRAVGRFALDEVGMCTEDPQR